MSQEPPVFLSQTVVNHRSAQERDRKLVPGRVGYDCMDSPGKKKHRQYLYDTLGIHEGKATRSPTPLERAYRTRGWLLKSNQPEISTTSSSSTVAVGGTEPSLVGRFTRKQHTPEPPGNPLDQAFELVGPQITANAEKKRRHEQKQKQKLVARDASNAGPSTGVRAKATDRGVARPDKGKGKQRAANTGRRSARIIFSDDSWEDDDAEMASTDEDVAHAGRPTTNVPVTPPRTRPVSSGDAQSDSDEIIFPSKPSRKTAPRAQDSLPAKAASAAGRARLVRAPPPAPPTRSAAHNAPTAPVHGSIGGAKGRAPRTDKAKGKQRAASPTPVDYASEHEDAMAVDEPEPHQPLHRAEQTAAKSVADTQPWPPHPAAPTTTTRPSTRASASASSHASPHTPHDAPRTTRSSSRGTSSTHAVAPAPAPPAPPTQRRAEPKRLGLNLPHAKPGALHAPFKAPGPAVPSQQGSVLPCVGLGPSQTQVMIASVLTTMGFPVPAAAPAYGPGARAAGSGAKRARGAPVAVAKASLSDEEEAEPPSSYDGHFPPLDIEAVERMMVEHDRRPTV
ncbi:hypothetical protein PsYK624_100930 [Phanerochaete sordida]|uniref:Uncharacterized protein n=1 Tax=Phanerochaete sordida TaxID=48140 RepID=A0A9P3LGL8_9APHY|nr:hypothetical protein PsYK624_100930 [Phanerochaete sordida]